MSVINPFLEHGHEPEGTELVVVLLPGGIEPEARELRFGDPLDAELRIAGVGYVSGGGNLLSEPDEDGRRKIIFAGVDVDTLDMDAARSLLRDHLPDLGCPAESRIQYGGLQDRYDGTDWHLEEPRNDAV